MPSYTINGQEIHTVEEGLPNRQVALLIHGWSSSSYALKPLAAILSQRFHCVSIDLPGYGNSPPFKGGTTIEKYADLVASLIEKISDGPVVLVGHSMGGMISAALALKQPVLVERMVLICPTITGILSTRINLLISPITLLERFGVGQVVVNAVERMLSGLTDRLMRPVSFADRTGITEADYARLRTDARRPEQGKVRAECYFAMRAYNLSGRIGAIDTPTLAIWGAEDNTVPLRDAGVVADEWPKAELRILPKAGHWPHFENPEPMRRMVAAYLGLPLLSSALHTPLGDGELERIEEIAAFLAHSSICNNMSRSQRTRLAGQLRHINLPPYRNLVDRDSDRQEMFIIQDGTVDVWSDPDAPGEMPKQPRKVASLKPGEMTGELSMLDQGTRTADLISGPLGATVLALGRERLQALREDDPELGSILLWNIAKAMSTRVRFILWQLQRAGQRVRDEQKQKWVEQGISSQSSDSGTTL
jgi:pimeloyl-ACP methyl ester carboxylesterase/CRP-like cAMP-binding protein